MAEIRFSVDGRLGKTNTYALVSEGEDPVEAVALAAVDAFSTGVEITAGGVTMHLAAWLDPSHWGEDWREAGVDDVYEWAAALG